MVLVCVDILGHVSFSLFFDFLKLSVLDESSVGRKT